MIPHPPEPRVPLQNGCSNIRLVVVGSHMQQCVARHVPGIRCSPGMQQLELHIVVPVVDGIVEWRLVTFVFDVDWWGVGVLEFF